MATSGNPLTDDNTTNIDTPGKNEPVEDPGVEEEDQDELEREEGDVDRDDPL